MAGLIKPEVAIEKDKPTYECPKCHEIAMQFFHTHPNQPNRDDSFICRACGRTWEM